jgi:DNA-binding IclR family transcriptional regulator
MPTPRRATRQAHPATDIDDARGSRGIQSIEVGGRLLKALVHLGRRVPLKDLAREADMTPAKAHPYLVSFGKLGLIEQDPASGHYGLGSLALQVGLISLQQADPVRMASAELPALAQAIGQTVGLAVWGNRGPTFIRLEEGPTAVHVNMRHGTVVSVKGTASGRLFAAFAPRERLLDALRWEAGSARVKLEPSFEKELAQIRHRRFCALVDGSVPGVAAIAAPVFDGFGDMVMALTAIGPKATLDHAVSGMAARALMRAADALSRRLGAKPVVAV